MNEKPKNYKNRIVGRVLFLILFPLIFPLVLFPQQFAVNGKITVSTLPVGYASISFIDNNDTSIIFSTVTDTFGNYQINIITDIKKPKDNQPVNFELEQNYPNPFSSSTAISYKLNTLSSVKVTIYDILGRKIKNFTVGVQQSGRHAVVWNGENDFGKKVATGIYFCRLQIGDKAQVKKMIYGMGEKDFKISLPKTSSVQASETENQLNINLLAGNYTVRIENTENIVPIITPKQVENVAIQSDTTFDFDVTRAVIVHLDSTKQVISGFGAANIVSWRPDMTPGEINTAFGTGDGQIGFSILRLRIPYRQSDFNINVPSAQAAHAMGVKIIASPWSPPPELKTNNNIVSGRLRDDSYAAFAAHLDSFTNYMSNNGAPIYAISVQNEPDVQVGYESCDWTADEMLRFMKENAQDVGTGVFAAESFNFNHSMTDPILNDSVATSNTAFIGGHIYGGGLTKYSLAEAKGKEVWMTEHLELSSDWTGALNTAKEINDCMKANMSAYIWWYIVRFYGPIYDDEGPPGTQKGDVSKRGFVMSQFSRFVRPGFFRVTVEDNPQVSVYVTAYKGSTKVVIVAINYGYQSRDQAFKIVNNGVVNFTPYVTSETKDATQEDDVAISNGMLTFTLEPRSVTTLVSE